MLDLGAIETASWVFTVPVEPTPGGRTTTGSQVRPVVTTNFRNGSRVGTRRTKKVVVVVVECRQETHARTHRHVYVHTFTDSNRDLSGEGRRFGSLPSHY